MNLDPSLVEILVCPRCHASLRVDHQAEELVCTAETCGLAYPVLPREPDAVGWDIPVLLIDEARRPDRPRTDGVVTT